MISSILLTVIGLGLLALILTAAFSPLETLSWWAGWTEDEIDEAAPPPTDQAKNGGEAERLYIVYFSGVASLSGRFLVPREKTFIRRLEARLPQARVIADVFPYSPAGRPLLAAPRLFERLWRWLQRLRIEGRRSLLTPLINMRNIYQVMVSADHRYGPIFNQGAAHAIEDALIEAGYARGDGAPIAIIGYSGGGQIAVGAAPFLAARLKAPIDVVAVGGVIASDPGLHFVRHLYHIVGERDRVQKFGAVMFPERWAVMAHSEWNMAMREGRITKIEMDDVLHAGARGYFGLVKADGVSNNERTLDEIVSILSPLQPSATP